MVHPVTALRLLSATLLLSGSAGLARAADLPVKAPVLAPVVYNWTGIYGGVQAGYGAGMKDWGGINFLAHGALAGGTIGVNQQIGNWVIGIEGDASWANIKGSRDEIIAIPFSVSNFSATIASKIDAVATIAARLGFAQDRWLVYVKAGGGWARETHTQSQVSTITGVPGAQSVSIEGKENRFGPMVGFGAEYAFLGNWSAKVEYNYFDFTANGIVRQAGTLTSFAGTTTNVATTVNIREQLHFAKVGLNYRFGPDGAPEIAASRPAPGYNWTGVYAGVQGAGAFGLTSFVGFAPWDRYDPKGWLAGGTVGVNVQAGAFVPGLELEWMGGRVNGGRTDITSITVGGTSTQSLATRIDGIAMATARMGFVAADRWLVYGKAGLALAHATHTNNFSFIGGPGVTSSIFNNEGDALHSGVVMGLGTEYAFLGNWSVKLEYDYIRFRVQDVFLPGTITEISPVLGTGTTSLPNSASIRQDLHLVKFGLNYRFNPGIDVISARY
jgi:outer membrane immunogenic protein